MSEAFTKYNAYKSEDKADKALKWSVAMKETAKDGYTISCMKRPIEKSTLVETKVTYKNIDAKKLVAAYMDYFDLDEALKEYKLIEKKDNSAVHYCKYGIPIPFVSDRDVVSEMSSTEVDGGIFVNAVDVEHADMPVDPKNFRMTVWSGSVFTQDGDNTTTLTYEFADAGHKILNGFDGDSIMGDISLVLKKYKMNG